MLLLWTCMDLLNGCAVSACINRRKGKIQVTKSITLTSQWVSLSCYEWLLRRLVCQRWEISHTVAYKHLSVNRRRGLTSIFMSLSGIGDATKSENPLGNKNMREVNWWSGAVDQDLWQRRSAGKVKKQDRQDVDTGSVKWLNILLKPSSYNKITPDKQSETKTWATGSFLRGIFFITLGPDTQTAMTEGKDEDERGKADCTSTHHEDFSQCTFPHKGTEDSGLQIYKLLL